MNNHAMSQMHIQRMRRLFGLYLQDKKIPSHGRGGGEMVLVFHHFHGVDFSVFVGHFH